MELATFDRDRDLDAAKRVWKEVGWVRTKNFRTTQPISRCVR